MNDVIDLHTHTIASGHAYNTINEMAHAAAAKGLSILGITEHAPKMVGSCSEYYFMNLRALPREKEGVRILYGVELNMLGFDGEADLPDNLLAQMDLVIASMHIPCMPIGTKEENTRAYLKMMENPYVRVIGHPDDSRYPIDYQTLAKAAAEHHVLLEINNSSLSPKSFRPGAEENCREMLSYCRKYQTRIIMDSDAHVDLDVGNHMYARKLLEEEQFPMELVMNDKPEGLLDFLQNR